MAPPDGLAARCLTLLRDVCRIAREQVHEIGAGVIAQASGRGGEFQLGKVASTHPVAVVEWLNANHADAGGHAAALERRIGFTLHEQGVETHQDGPPRADSARGVYRTSTSI